uniref:ATP synthase F(1) complex subunit delta, mitochondrial n=1 Tax=Strigamia maritima TaxID=126957 RepID=T1J226_STRMM
MLLIRTLLSAPRTIKSCSKFTGVAVNQYRHYSNGQAMSFTFAAPSTLFYNNADVKQVDVPSFSGNFGILPNHVPTLAVIKPGVLTVYEKDGNTKKYFVSSGSIAVNDDSSVQILAEEAVLVEQLDLQACREGLSSAQQQLTQASTDEAKAEAQINIEVHEALVKAAE